MPNKAGKDLPSTFPAILADIVDKTEGGRKAKEEAGRTAATLMECCNNILLPISALNYGFKKAKDYFTERFEKDLSEKMSFVNPQSIVEPKPSIVAPILEGLAFSHDEPDLKEMFMDLLANAMNKEGVPVHPAFSGIIKQMSSEEARFFKSLFTQNAIPYLRMEAKDKIHSIASRKVVRYFFAEDINDEFSIFDYQSWIDNFSRLGLILIYENHYLADKALYDGIRSQHVYAGIKRHIEEEANQIFSDVKAYIMLTSFGLDFCGAVGIRY